MTTIIDGIEYKYSPAWKRLIALTIDLSLVWLLTVSIHFMSPRPIPDPFFNLILFVLFMTYSTYFDFYQHGTPGKHIMKIKVLYAYHHRSYLLTTFYRNLLKGLFAILIFEFFWILLVPYRQGYHNQIAKCIIVDNHPDATTANKSYRSVPGEG